MIDKWKEQKKKQVLDSPIFSVDAVEMETPEKKISTFYRLNTADWVTVIPRLPDGRFILVRQFRHGSANVTTEFPAGTIDPGEDPETCARRELLEETGYKAGSLKLLASVNPNPAFMTNTTHTFLAEDLECIGDRNLDEHEFVDTVLLPEGEVIRQMGTGELINGVSIAAFFFWFRSRWMSVSG
jgi:ADP-ribose pyrophosphatase